MEEYNLREATPGVLEIKPRQRLDGEKPRPTLMPGAKGIDVLPKWAIRASLEQFKADRTLIDLYVSHNGWGAIEDSGRGDGGIYGAYYYDLVDGWQADIYNLREEGEIFEDSFVFRYQDLFDDDLEKADDLFAGLAEETKARLDRILAIEESPNYVCPTTEGLQLELVYGSS